MRSGNQVIFRGPMTCRVWTGSVLGSPLPNCNLIITNNGSLLYVVLWPDTHSSINFICLKFNTDQSTSYLALYEDHVVY